MTLHVVDLTSDPLTQGSPDYKYSSVTYDATNDLIDISWVRERTDDADYEGVMIGPFGPLVGPDVRLRYTMNMISSTLDAFATQMPIVLSTTNPMLEVDAATTDPKVMLRYSWDTDLHAARGVRAEFRNAAGGQFAVGWVTVSTGVDHTVDVWMADGVGYLKVNSNIQSVALSGDFTGNYQYLSWEPLHATGNDEGISDEGVFEMRDIVIDDEDRDPDTSYADLIAADGASYHLPLDDIGGTLVRSTVGSSGTYSGTPGYRVAGPSPMIPYGVRLDAPGTDFVSLPNSIDCTAAMTWECWVRLDTTTSQVVLGKDDSGSQNIPILMRVGSNLNVIIKVSDTTYQVTGGSVTAGEWHHVAATIGAGNGQTLRIYLNGEEVGSVVASTRSNVGSPYAGYSPDSFFARITGNVASVAAYTSVLSAEQIRNHYREGAGLNLSTSTYDDIVLSHGPILYLPLDDQAGPTAWALAGSDGTYSGLPTLGVTGPTPVNSDGISTDGTDDAMTTPSITLGATQPQTWEIWADGGAISHASGGKVLAKSDTYSDRWSVGHSITEESDEIMTIYSTESGVGVTTWSGTGSISDGWHHHVLVFTGSSNAWTWYQDGVAQTGKAASVGGGADGLRTDSYGFAKHVSTHYLWDGLAALAVYDYALTPAQILNHYRAAPPAFTTIAAQRAESLGAVLHLPLDDVGGTVARATIGDAGTYAGGPTLEVAGPSNFIPKGISTDGTDDEVAIGTIGEGFTSAQSWEIWADFGSAITSASGFKVLVSETSSNANYLFLGGGISGSVDNEICGVVTVSDAVTEITTWGQASGFTTISDGWHHYVFTFDGTQDGWTFYVDGVGYSSHDTSNGGAYGLPSVARDLSARTNNSNWYAFDGLAAFTVYDFALTPEQVYANYRLGLDLGAGTSFGPVSY